MQSFSTLVREATQAQHTASESAAFMERLMSGSGSTADYAALLRQYAVIYAAIECAQLAFADDEVVVPFISPELTRLPALELDLAHLLGPGWQDTAVLPAAADYARRVRERATASAPVFLAHHYIRYLGDLSGGQVMRTLVARHYGVSDAGLAFLTFTGIPKPKLFKDAYRARLDALPFDAEQRRELIDEVRWAFDAHGELFAQLDRRHDAARVV